MDGDGKAFLCPENDHFYATSKYESLDPGEPEIRLIELRPGRRNDPIICKLLQPVSLSSSKQGYLAISYCAGDPADIEPITLQDLQFNVFKPIAKVLTYIRKPHQSFHLWIDQLCIDQSNAEERAYQVSLMRYIYTEARETVAWLGYEDPNRIGDAFDLIRKICAGRKEFADCLKPMFSEEDQDRKAWDIEHACDSDVALQLQYQVILEPEDISPLEALVKLPWWTRCWILQGAILSKCVKLVYGNDAILLDDIQNAYNAIVLCHRTMFLEYTQDNTSRTTILKVVRRIVFGIYSDRFYQS